MRELEEAIKAMRMKHDVLSKKEFEDKIQSLHASYKDLQRGLQTEKSKEVDELLQLVK